MHKYLVYLLLLFGMACAGLDDEDFDDVRKVVIDGYVEQGAYPVVYLTYSSGFYEPVDSASLQQLVLPTARVEIFDGEQSEVLTLFRNTNVYPPYFYRATDIKGEAGKTYTLNVRSGGETYTAETTIPPVVAIDSAWVLPNREIDTLGNLWIRFSDAAQTANYYRVFTQVKGKDDQYVPAYQSTISDRLFDGKLHDYPILKLPNSFIEIGNDVLFNKGDTIRLRFCAINQEHFNFWRSLERELYLVGNPFGSSGNEVISNIQGTKPALGIWGGYGAAYRTIIFK